LEPARWWPTATANDQRNIMKTRETTLPRFSVLGAVVALAVHCVILRADDRSFLSDGVKIHYTVEGKGEPVVLLHGFAASSRLQWGVSGVYKALVNDYQMIALDLRGHGQSGKPHDADAYGIKMVEDVVRLMDELKIPKAHFVGYSLGSLVLMR